MVCIGIENIQLGISFCGYNREIKMLYKEDAGRLGGMFSSKKPPGKELRERVEFK